VSGIIIMTVQTFRLIMSKDLCNF